MLATDIKKRLDVLCSEETQFNSLLLDGPWGCGKTHNVKEYLKTKNNYAYISLFGLSTSNHLLMKLSEKLDSKYIEIINENYFIKSSLKEKYNGALLIFDDLERKNKKLSFDELYGVIDSLNSLGFKIVCIANSARIDEDELPYFLKFREKTFDSFVNVEADHRVFNEVLQDTSIEFESVMLKQVKDNWRMILKSYKCFQDIVKYFEDKGKLDFFDNIEISKNTFFRCVVSAIQCIYSDNQTKPNIKDEWGKIVYESNVSKYGLYTANELYELFSTQKENSSLKNHIEELISAISNSNYDILFDFYYPQEIFIDNSNELLYDEPFYLDDDGKRKYKELFFEKIDEMDFSIRQYESLVSKIISNYSKEMTDEEIDRLVSRIVKTIPIENSRIFIDKLFLTNELSSDSKLSAIKKKIEDGFYKSDEEHKKIDLESFINNKEYNKMVDYLYENKYSDPIIKEKILEILSNYNFAIPDLSKEINYTIWQYCHEIARFISDMPKYKEKFIDVLKAQCRLSKSSSLRQRCNALVKYNFNEAFDFYSIK